MSLSRNTRRTSTTASKLIAAIAAVSIGASSTFAQTPPSSGGAKLFDGVQTPQEEIILVESTGKARGKSVAADDVAFNDAMGTVEIHVDNADLVEVLRMLSLQSRNNIVASKSVTGSVTANLYNVTVRQALDAILHANGFRYVERGNFIYVYTAQELAEMEAADRVRETRVFRLYHTPAANASNLILPVLSDAGEVAVSAPAETGIASDPSNAGGDANAVNDALVVTDYPEALAKVEALLKEIDQRPQQILIEATILRATLNEDNALGIDFTVLGGVDFQSLSAVGSTASSLLTGGIASNPDAGGIVDGGAGGAQTGFTGNVPQGGLQMGLISNDVGVFVRALESVTDTVILANPKVLALNKQRGEVFVGRDDGYVTTTVTESSTVQTVEFLKTGTRLIFRPFIAADGYVRLEVHPEDSDGGLTAANLPFKVTTEVTSNVMIKDGHTIVIGGLFRESSSSTRGQVPGLGNIPVVGALFRNQRDRTTREEVIILITPHIVSDDDKYAQLSAEQLAEAEKLRVGVRKGMMWFGRERLADHYYQKALSASEKGNTRMARFFAASATNLNPKFTEAILLREELTGRTLRAADNSTIRNFVRDEMLADLERQSSPRSVRIVAEPAQPAVPANQALVEPISAQVTATATSELTEVSPAVVPIDQKPVFAQKPISEDVRTYTLPDGTQVAVPTEEVLRQVSRVAPSPTALLNSAPDVAIADKPTTRPTLAAKPAPMPTFVPIPAATPTMPPTDTVMILEAPNAAQDDGIRDDFFASLIRSMAFTAEVLSKPQVSQPLLPATDPLSPQFTDDATTTVTILD